MGLPKGALFSGVAVALAMQFLTACTSVNVDKNHANGNEQETERSVFSETVDENLHAARETPIEQNGETTGITPPFLPDGSTQDTIPESEEDSTKIKSPFSDALDKALEDAKNPPKKTKDKGTPPFFPKHDEPEEP